MRWLVAAAALTWVGALQASRVPGVVVLGLIGAAVATGRRPTGRAVVVCVVLFAGASEMAARSADGARPIESQRVAEVGATIVGDPERFGPSVRVDLEVGGRRVEAWARGPSAARLAPALAGERVVVSGRVGPLPHDGPWWRVRHVVGRMTIDSVGDRTPGDLPSRAANGLRRTLSDGAEVLGDRGRPLFLGLVLGDDRGQDPLLVDAFAGSGLTHLLAVSGSNVAFVMALVGPLLRRLGFGLRLGATIGVLAFFALVTRFEPSVLRATVMAGLGAAAVAFGWDAESRRVLPVAVVVLLLVDPVLARSLGFQLSVAASAGIVWWSRRIALALPGPRAVADALSVTVAAQLAVAPLLIPAFGSMPVASVPANLLAGPAAGLVMVWGLPAGLVAGLLGSPIDGWLHQPTGAALWWLSSVAEASSRAPLGELGGHHLALLLLAAGLAVAPVAWSSRRVVALVVAAAVVHPAWMARVPGGGEVALGPGAVLHEAAGAVVVELDVGVRPRSLLEGLRRAGVDRIDVVVAVHGGREVAESVALLGERSPPRLVLAPVGHRIRHGSVPPAGGTITVGGLAIRVVSSSPRLEVEVRPTGRSP